jgi:hypothetical protein
LDRTKVGFFSTLVKSVQRPNVKLSKKNFSVVDITLVDATSNVGHVVSHWSKELEFVEFFVFLIKIVD